MAFKLVNYTLHGEDDVNLQKGILRRRELYYRSAETILNELAYRVIRATYRRRIVDVFASIALSSLLPRCLHWPCVKGECQNKSVHFNVIIIIVIITLIYLSALANKATQRCLKV